MLKAKWAQVCLYFKVRESNLATWWIRVTCAVLWKKTVIVGVSGEICLYFNIWENRDAEQTVKEIKYSHIQVFCFTLSCCFITLKCFWKELVSCFFFALIIFQAAVDAPFRHLNLFLKTGLATFSNIGHKQHLSTLFFQPYLYTSWVNTRLFFVFLFIYWKICCCENQTTLIVKKDIS